MFWSRMVYPEPEGPNTTALIGSFPTWSYFDCFDSNSLLSLCLITGTFILYTIKIENIYLAYAVHVKEAIGVDCIKGYGSCCIIHLDIKI